MHIEFSDVGNQFDSLMNFISTKMPPSCHIALVALHNKIGRNQSIYTYFSIWIISFRITTWIKEKTFYFNKFTTTLS